MTVDDFFKKTTGNEPYPYQRRFAEADELPSLLSVPTGVGKTATALLGWLWRRRFADESTRKQTPRRLIYCLPMRTLVDQTKAECQKWRANLELTKDVGVHVLMGGEDGTDWDEFPERDAIIIGTQDMLLSRALNRGYGMSRYRWPMHFGLLNNDCLWVLDETQLMGVGLTTSCQLAGLREKLNTYGNCHTLWMSATLDNDALGTIDHAQPDPVADGLTLDDDDQASDRVMQLLTAKKPLAASAVQLSPDSAKKGYESAAAEEIIGKHQAGTLTLAVVNNVKRAQKLYANLTKTAADDAESIVLIHSRFRPSDRLKTQQAALNESTIDKEGFGRIVIATQAIEAGVDISATTLFTELAPWSSLVQRFGRCNRRGFCGAKSNPDAAVYWIDCDTSDEKKAKTLCLPYEVASLNAARQQLELLSDVGPKSLDGISVEEPQPVVHVLRRKDLLDLFDTTPDLSGNDLDVSRYIRDSDDTDVQVYWRSWDRKASLTPPPVPKDVKNEAFPRPQRDELCSVPVGQMKTFADKLKKTVPALVWDPLTAGWQTVGKFNVRPGMTILLHETAGGYDSKLGWTADAKHKPVVPVPVEVVKPNERMADDDTVGAGEPVELTQHLRDVAYHSKQLAACFGDEIPHDCVSTAARWHDVGKAHEAFQTAMHDFESVPGDIGDGHQWAKPVERGMPHYRIVLSEKATTANPPFVGQAVPDATDQPNSTAVATAPAATKPRYESRRGFRHELASALAWLAHHQHNSSDETDLVAYLIAAHHGKVRLSIRSMPNEPVPKNSSKRFARGIYEGDPLPSVDLGNGESSTAIESISLDLMSLGESASGPSWLARMLDVRNSHGPFRLALLETLVRIADWRGSADPGCGGER